MKPHLPNLKSLLTALLILPSVLSLGQSLFFRRYEPGMAFPEARMHLATEDHNGYLWLGTDEGVMRFDGLRFDKPDTGNKAAVGGKVTALYCDRRGKMWAGFQDGSIAHTTTMGKWRLWDLEEGLPQAPVTGFCESADGLFWISTYGEGLYCFDGKHLLNISTDDDLPSNDIYALEQMNEEVWAGTDAGIAVCRVSKGKKRVSRLNTSDGLPDPIVTALLRDSKGNCWTGMHDGGLAYYDKSAGSFFCPVSDWTYGVVTSLALLEGRELYIGTEGGGLLRYNMHSGALSHINGKSGLSRTKVSGLHVGAEGHLSVMTQERGFYSANLQFALSAGPQGNVQAILADHRNRIWAGTAKGLWMLNQTTENFVPYSLKGKNITSLFEDAHGNIWVGTFGQGLFILPSTSDNLLFFNEKNGLTNNSILSIEGIDKRVWLATLGGVTEFELNGNISRYAPKAIRNYQQENGLGTNFVYSAFADSRGRIWFGTDGKGISVLDKGKIRNYNQAITRTGETHTLHTVYSIAEDDDGKIWFTTSKDGLFAFDGTYFQRIHYTDGLRGKGVACLYRDGSGNLLLAHKEGIDLLDPRTGHFIHFERGAGLVDFEPNLNAVSGDREGRVWVGAQVGALRYTPLGLKRPQYPKTVLEGVSVFLQPVDFQNVNTFKHGENSLVFHFAGLWRTDPERVRYKYRLLGFNADWIQSADRQATFPNLPPGRYTFEVSTGLDEAFEPRHSVRYAFRIRAPFWQQWWFISGVLALTAAAFAAWIRQREKRLQEEALRKKEAVENQFEVLKSQINPHFLFNSFNTLAAIIEEDPPAAVQYVEKLSDLFRNVLQYREKELISMAEEQKVLEDYIFLLEKRHGKNVKIQIHIPESEGSIAPLTLQLLVENAVKHNVASALKPLHISVYTTNGSIVVENNLQPRLGNAGSTGMGLKNIIRRYELLSKKPVHIEKSADIFRVFIPIIQSDET